MRFAPDLLFRRSIDFTLRRTSEEKKRKNIGHVEVFHIVGISSLFLGGGGTVAIWSLSNHRQALCHQAQVSRRFPRPPYPAH